jgi:hypothetical protein
MSDACGWIDPRRRPYNIVMTTLTENEERLVQALRSLPPEAAEKVFIWATQLSELANGGTVDRSDTWTDEDLQDAGRASLSNFEEGEAGRG